MGVNCPLRKHGQMLAGFRSLRHLLPAVLVTCVSAGAVGSDLRPLSGTLKKTITSDLSEPAPSLKGEGLRLIKKRTESTEIWQVHQGRSALLFTKEEADGRTAVTGFLGGQEVRYALQIPKESLNRTFTVLPMSFGFTPSELFGLYLDGVSLGAKGRTIPEFIKDAQVIERRGTEVTYRVSKRQTISLIYAANGKELVKTVRRYYSGKTPSGVVETTFSGSVGLDGDTFPRKVEAVQIQLAMMGPNESFQEVERIKTVVELSRLEPEANLEELMPPKGASFIDLRFDDGLTHTLIWNGSAFEAGPTSVQRGSSPPSPLLPILIVGGLTVLALVWWMIRRSGSKKRVTPPAS